MLSLCQSECLPQCGRQTIARGRTSRIESPFPRLVYDNLPVNGLQLRDDFPPRLSPGQDPASTRSYTPNFCPWQHIQPANERAPPGCSKFASLAVGVSPQGTIMWRLQGTLRCTQHAGYLLRTVHQWRGVLTHLLRSPPVSGMLLLRKHDMLPEQVLVWRGG
jgi:hypothetical protein